MPKSKSLDSIIAEAEQIARVWTENPTFNIGTPTLPEFEAMVADLRTRRDQTQALRNQLTAAVNETNTRSGAISGVVSRARSGFRAMFGPDSTQYEQAGGTRTSERKRPARKPKPE